MQGRSKRLLARGRSRGPPARRGSRSSRRSRSSTAVRVRVRLAASSIASGSPSSRAQIRSIARSSSRYRVEVAPPACALEEECRGSLLASGSTG